VSDFIASVAEIYFMDELAIKISRIVECLELSFLYFVGFVFFVFLDFSPVLTPKFELELRFFMRNIGKFPKRFPFSDNLVFFFIFDYKR